MRAAAAFVCAGLISIALTGCSQGSRPTDPTAPARNSTAERELSAQDQADLDAWLAERAAGLSIADPPQVDRVRLVSQADTPQTQIDCLTAAGFPATLTDDGQGWQVEIPAGQQEPYNLAAYTCAAQYPTDPAQADSRITETQKKIAYKYLTETLVTCLADRGYEVGGIPTEATFLGTWDTVRWNPYDQLASVPKDVVAQCPPNTPAELMWGS